ncbi:MAG: hypothetical protein KF709_08540 [Gemmatimonadaceae bacterium]|nr:hypothetical protein [Gemmatimonadaceae bacterium]
MLVLPSPTRMLVSCAVVLLVLGPASAAAQAISLTRPVAQFAEPFSSVRGVRELPDGRVLVADYIENRVALVDLSRGTSVDVLTDGGGPRNVRLPMGLVALGDSTAVLDVGNSRLVVVAPDAAVVRATVVERPGRMGVRGLLRDGSWAYAVPAWAEGPAALPDDSVRIVAWQPGSDRETTLFTVQGTRYRKDRSPSQEPRIPTVGFAGQDAWLVTADGGIRVVRHSPYRVERRAPDGTWSRGPVQAAEPRPVTPADKRRFVREFAATNPISGRGENGGMGRDALPDDRQVARQVEITEWAVSHASFQANGVFAAPGNRLWVSRDGDPTRPARYDVFDGEGRRVQEVTLPAGRRVVQVTSRGVYVLRENADGEQFLERYALP